MGKEPGLIILDRWSYRLARDLYYWLPANIASSVVVSTKVESQATNSSASPAAPKENRDESRPSSNSPGSSDSSDSSSGSTSQVRKVSAPCVVGFGGSAFEFLFGTRQSMERRKKARAHRGRDVDIFAILVHTAYLCSFHAGAIPCCSRDIKR